MIALFVIGAAITAVWLIATANKDLRDLKRIEEWLKK